MLAVLMEYQTATIALRMKVKAATIDVLVIVSDATITLPTKLDFAHRQSRPVCTHRIELYKNKYTRISEKYIIHILNSSLSGPELT